MFDTVLVADRGDSACRVIAACQKLGIKAVSVHSVGDARAAHVSAADESVLLGAEGAYGDELALVEAARQTGAQAVHPGAGPLADSPSFARAVREAGLIWIAPVGDDVAGQLRQAAAQHQQPAEGRPDE